MTFFFFSKRPRTMEKMLQSLLRLRCQTFLEKTYLRNSALNPRIVLHSSPQLLHPNAARDRAAIQQIPPPICTNNISPLSPQSRLFSLYLKGFFLMWVRLFYCSLSLLLGMSHAGKQWGPAGTPFCNTMGCSSCCLLPVSRVAALWLRQRQAGGLGLFQWEKKTQNDGRGTACQSTW